MREKITAARGAVRRAIRLLGQRGPAGVARRLLERIVWRGDAAAVSDPERAAAEDFDRRYGVETAGVEGEHLNLASVAGRNWRDGVAYQGARRASLALIDAIAPAHAGSTFVDVGSGKGKVLFHAANHPFRRIVGVEYSARLHAAAEANIARYRNPRRRCERIESVCADAAEFEFPPETGLVYLFNPFGRAVLERVAANLVDSLRREPRQIAVLYCNALHADVFRSAGFRETARWSGEFESVLIEPAAPLRGADSISHRGAPASGTA